MKKIGLLFAISFLMPLTIIRCNDVDLNNLNEGQEELYNQFNIETDYLKHFCKRNNLLCHGAKRYLLLRKCVYGNDEQACLTLARLLKPRRCTLDEFRDELKLMENEFPSSYFKQYYDWVEWGK